MNDKILNPTVYAFQKTLSFQASPTLDQLQQAAEGFLVNLRRVLHDEGCRLIGHIKGVIEADSGCFLKFNITRFQDPIRLNGYWSGGTASASLKLNVIVYNVEKYIVENAVLRGIEEHFTNAGMEK